MINVEQAVTAKYPSLRHYPRLMTAPFLALLKKLFYEERINRFLTAHGELEGVEFVEAVLDELEVDYAMASKDRANIPPAGRVVIIANHPMGGLDGLALLKLVSEVRKDVKIVANDLLMQFEPLQKLLLPVDNLGGKAGKKSLLAIHKALENEEAVIIFPAGEVSRIRPTGVKDGAWNSGFLKLAAKADAPILPVRIRAKNSSLFYTISTVYKPLSALMLPGELFKHRGKTIRFVVGAPVPKWAYDLPTLSLKRKAKLMKEHLFRLGRKGDGIFATETCIAHPEDRQALKAELKKAQLLGDTSDGKKIYLYNFERNSPLIREIGRLRELTFRKVGEGTGLRRDNDRYDRDYRHLILWDEERLELVGSYRIGETDKLLEHGELSRLYIPSLFEINEGFEPYLRHAIELGRSFVQPRFWGTRALDYLWQGIGAYLRHHPEIKYMFGPVSISGSYPKAAKEMLVWYYSRYYGHKGNVARSKNPFTLSRAAETEMAEIFSGSDAEEDFKTLKEHLGQMGVAVPTLYKQYADVCEADGVKYCAFGVDPDFNDCIDGLLVVDVDRIKPAKRKRYIG